MAETKYVCVPVEPTREMLAADKRAAQEPVRYDTIEGQQRRCWAAALAAAPQSHIAVERSQLERWLTGLEFRGDVPKQVWQEIRTLLAKE